MIKRVPHQEPAEEIANAITHGVGLFLSVLGSIFLLVLAAESNNPWHIWGSLIYCATLISVYLSSTLYHSARDPKMKLLLKRVDHACIYLFIAGTYTIILFTLLRGPSGWWMFAAQWGVALTGVIIKIFYPIKSRIVGAAIYLAMAWMGVLIMDDFARMVPAGGVDLMWGGAFFYTFGVLFYILGTRIRFFHSVWHLFVLSGTACHYFLGAVYLV